MANIGRPSSFTQEMADTICARLAEGESLRSVCRDDGTPDTTTVMRWLAREDETGERFRHQYARAKELGAEKIAEEILEIADDGSNDWMEQRAAEDEQVAASWKFNGEAARRSQLRIDARKWLLSKLAPKKYGDKTETTLRGDPQAPVGLILNGSDVHG